MYSFGAKTVLSKTDRAYLAKISKNDLINEALSLNLIVDEKLTKQQIFNQIKKYKQSLEKEKKYLDMQDLFKSLPDTYSPYVKQPDKYAKYRESDILYYPELQARRLPPGSKIIRKEEGLTKTQKTEIRKEIKNEIDRLADLLEQFK